MNVFLVQPVQWEIQVILAQQDRPALQDRVAAVDLLVLLVKMAAMVLLVLQVRHVPAKQQKGLSLRHQFSLEKTRFMMAAEFLL
jgi:hypothetical protein